FCSSTRCFRILRISSSEGNGEACRPNAAEDNATKKIRAAKRCWDMLFLLALNNAHEYPRGTQNHKTDDRARAGQEIQQTSPLDRTTGPVFLRGSAAIFVQRDHSTAQHSCIATAVKAPPHHDQRRRADGAPG